MLESLSSHNLLKKEYQLSFILLFILFFVLRDLFAVLVADSEGFN
jgi:hypothetical protein